MPVDPLLPPTKGEGEVIVMLFLPCGMWGGQWRFP